MILTGLAIQNAVVDGSIRIDPFSEAAINPNSYNFHLHDNVLQRSSPEEKWKSNRITEKGMILSPKMLYLAATAEVIGSNKYVTTLLGRSSIGRLGIFLNITADLGHVGSCSRWTLEMTVVQPVRVYPGMTIGQVAFWKILPSRDMDSSKRISYSGRYHHHQVPTPNLDLNLE